MPEGDPQIDHADEEKEHQSEQSGRPAYELPRGKAGSGGEQRASDEIRPEPARRHVRRDRLRDKRGAAEMLGREGSQWNRDEDTGQEDELVPGAGRAELFAKDEDPGGKIKETGKRHPEIGGRKHREHISEEAAEIISRVRRLS